MWATCCEAWLVFLPLDSVRQWELYLAIQELLGICSPALCGRHLFNTDDLYRMGTSAMASSHVTIALCNSAGRSQITVLPVHVVCATTGVVTKPDAKVLDLQWLLLGNLITA